MCGIAGRLGPGDSGEDRRMLARMRHRGPDDRGEVTPRGGWLGHTRLSIVDVAGGRQPLGGDERWLVANGEIYNHGEVRRSLPPRRYATASDNEVALAMLQESGPEGLGELEGMYALLSSGADGTGFVAARDPVGIKPLYWTPPGSGPQAAVRFASEMAAFDSERRPAVEAFPPGHAWTPEDGLRRFAAPVAEAAPQDGPRHRPAAEPGEGDLAAVRDTLIAAVQRQMMGDVPVGVFLSGGLDSTLVAAIAARWCAARGERLQTFAVGLERSSDLLAARRAADHLGTLHRERTYTAQEARSAVEPVVRAIEHFDASLVRSAVPNFLLAELAAEHVKVVLTGEGADELFAGYAYYHEQFADPETLHDELVASIEGLSGLNLQRCDRVTMAHSLEARVPFLDREMITFALGLPAAWKTAGSGVAEKWLLRRAFEGWLPDDLLWRAKEQFGDGSGAASVLTSAAEEHVSDAELTADATGPMALRSREELAYHRIWHAHLRGIDPEKTLTRFATT